MKTFQFEVVSRTRYEVQAPNAEAIFLDPEAYMEDAEVIAVSSFNEADRITEVTSSRSGDRLGNVEAREGYDRCVCGCKYWENDRCIDCGASVSKKLTDDETEAGR